MVIIFITLSRPLHPKMFSTELLRRPVLVGHIRKMRPVLVGHIRKMRPILVVVSKKRHVLIVVSKRRPVLIAVSNQRHVRSVVFKEKTEEKEHVSFNLKVVLLENLEVSMIFTDEDQAPFVEGLDSRMSLSQPGENDANTGSPAQARLESIKMACDLTQNKDIVKSQDWIPKRGVNWVLKISGKL